MWVYARCRNENINVKTEEEMIRDGRNEATKIERERARRMKRRDIYRAHLHKYITSNLKPIISNIFPT